MSDDHLPAPADQEPTQPVHPAQGQVHPTQHYPTQHYPAQPYPVQPAVSPSQALPGQPQPQAAYGHSYAQTTIVRPRVGSAHIAVAWVAAVLTLGYFLPWAVAATRQKSNTLAIGLVNFLLGWTFIGWVAALVMACTTDKPVAITNVAYAVAPTQQASAPADWYPDGTGQRRYWDGVRWTQHTAP